MTGHRGLDVQKVMVGDCAAARHGAASIRTTAPSRRDRLSRSYAIARRLKTAARITRLGLCGEENLVGGRQLLTEIRRACVVASSVLRRSHHARPHSIRPQAPTCILHLPG